MDEDNIIEFFKSELEYNKKENRGIIKENNRTIRYLNRFKKRISSTYSELIPAYDDVINEFYAYNASLEMDMETYENIEKFLSLREDTNDDSFNEELYMLAILIKLMHSKNEKIDNSLTIRINNINLRICGYDVMRPDGVSDIVNDCFDEVMQLIKKDSN